MYDYQCTCGNIQEEFRPIADRSKSPLCNKCGGSMNQIITGGFRNGMKGYPYQDPILERTITSPGQKRSILKQLGLEQKV